MRHKPIARAPQPTPAPSAGTVHFNIERITLHGYSGTEQRRFQSSLESNLARFARDAYTGMVQEFSLRHLDFGQLPAGATPEAAARHIATRIVAALDGPGARHA
jgi:hypothetical protein